MHPLGQCTPDWGLSDPATPLWCISDQFQLVPLRSQGLNLIK